MRETTAREDMSAEALLGLAADEFTQCLERGEQPDIEEFARRYPQIEAVLRQVLPALRVLRPTGTGHPPVASAACEVSGQLGDYRIVREIGRGGMGVVYEAEQISLNRRVALKVLPFAAVLDTRQLQRFKKEAQAAAQLHHTNIVPVFAVGCERGVHYYAMQYIDGQPLSVVIRELRQLAGQAPLEGTPSSVGTSAAVLALLSDAGACPPPDEAPAPPPVPAGGPTETIMTQGATNTPAYFRAIAQLGVQAADALQHAHDAGVVHRDIKPANLLLDAAGHIWITDFGLATIRSDPGLTLPGDLLGTVRYMSPEQARAGRLPVDQRTDIYGLGATLYELLGLRPAVAGDDREELLRRIVHVDPLPLRRVNPAVPAELEIIVAKALAKYPSERYASARALAEDLERFLSNRPILARPPTWPDRAAKWTRRHHTIVSAAAVVLVLAVIGLSISTLLIAQQRAEALRQRDLASAQRSRAEENLRLAQATMDRVLTRLTAEELGGGAQMERLRHALLEDPPDATTVTLLNKSPADAIRAGVTQAYTRVAHLNALLGRDAEAEDAYQAARAACEELPGAATDAPQRAALARSYGALATFLWERGRPMDAELPATRAWSGWAGLAAEFPSQLDYQRDVACSLNLLGLVLRDLDRPIEAEERVRACVATWKSLASECATVPQYRLELARALRNHATLMVRGGQCAAAALIVAEVLELQRALVRGFPAELDYGAELAYTQRWWEEVERCDSTFPRAAQPRPELPRYQELVAELPELPWYRGQLVRAYSALEHALAAAGRADEADTAHDEAVALQEQLAASFPNVVRYRAELVDLHVQRASALHLAWRLGDSEAAYRRAIALQEQLVVDFPEHAGGDELLTALQKRLAELLDERAVGELVALGKRSPAGVAEAVALARAARLDDVAARPFTLLIYGEYLGLGGDYERAAAVVQQAIGAGGREASFYKSLGWALLGCGRVAEARAAFEQAVPVGRRDPDLLARQCPDPTTAAYFLDLISETAYTAHWADIVLLGTRYAPFPWFYVGLRQELAGDLAAARAAYGRCVELGQQPQSHHTAHWAAYRLERLLEREPTQANGSLTGGGVAAEAGVSESP